MKAPVRIQLARQKGFRLQETSWATNGLPAIKVDRSTRWGNPWRILFPAPPERPCWWVQGPSGWTEEARTAADATSLSMRKFRYFAESNTDLFTGLRGKNLACWCRLDQSCHADVLLEIANR